jgi:3-isopropylmalate/(R)-2-methylmalate dehydratase large subunit
VTIQAAAPRSLFAKLWDQHVVEPDQTGDALLAIDRIFLHERTGSVALQGLREAGRNLHDPARVFCTMDHIVDTFPGRGDETRVPGGANFIRETRASALAAGIRLFDVTDPRQGIVHVISPELGIVLPGATLVCPDSHTCTQGAFGALAWGIGSTQAEHALATGTLRLARPRAMRVNFEGALPGGTGAKDMALALIAQEGAGGGAGSVVEFAGSAVRALGMEGRMTLCNMAAEFSAMTAIVAPDEATFAYLHGRAFAPAGALWLRALENWRALPSEAGATFDRDITLDVTDLAPMITWGTSPEHATAVTGSVPVLPPDGPLREARARALDYMGLEEREPLEGKPIDAAFIGSCTNSRLSDLRRAAQVLRGRRVAAGVRAICVPGSSSVKRAAEAEGIDRVFLDAGFEWRESGCSMCFYAGGESFGARARVVSSTNRNFESRQGPQTRTHIASPETVAASAIAGCIADVRKLASAVRGAA